MIEAPLVTLANKAIRDRVKQALETKQRLTVTVLSSLLTAQDELGYLPDEAIEETASFTKTSTNDVWGVASFYKNFRFELPTPHVIEVCWGPTCSLLGATEVIQKIQSLLGISNEGDTPDSSATLRYNTCLGACAQAPVVSIDHDLKGRVDSDRVVAEINDIFNDEG